MPAHLKAIVICERVGAVISLMGVLLIFLAFGSFKRLRTVPNTFIVFASFANLGASIACVIGYSGVLAGSTSPLCQAQAFMFELFMQSDPWWSLAMAVNVFMVFFCAANPNNLLRYWYLYFLVCYGVPFIPALALLVLRNDHGNVYGNATIWCWIDKDWSGLRIYTYYLPIWVCLVLSLCIYIAVGYRVFKQRNQLRNLSLSTRMRDMPTDSRDSGEKELSGNAAVMGTATIREEVLTTTTINTLSEPMPVYLGDGGGRHDVGSWIKGPAESSSLAYSSDQAHIHPALRRAGPHHQRVATPGAAVTTSITAEPRARQTFRQRVHGFFARVAARITNMDPVKWAYLRTSFVFAVTVLVTWTPSSINRIHDMVRPDEFSFGLSLASSIVLPLQGTWNAVIFFYTSWGPLREEVRTWVDFYFLGVPVGQGAADAVRRERDVDNNNRHVDTYEDDDGVRSEISDVSSRRRTVRLLHQPSLHLPPPPTSPSG
ncbi:hypothetical protein F5Y17DRAFT_469741 [Xylariaceae sp. FL0594]|nr:hypothetical protein F5Y17DRAFT_469741 [Xylariaceae sp. FL0594]